MRCSTITLERLAVLAATLLLAACGASAEPPQLAIAAAARNGDTLTLAIGFQPSAAQLAALEEGVPLTLAVRAGTGRAAATWRVGLRYFPLSSRYQLHIDGLADRSFALRGYLFAALENLRLPLPPQVCGAPRPCRVTVEQAHAALPGPLRLPSLFEADWRVPRAVATVGGKAT